MPNIAEGEMYELSQDRHCTYKIDFWDKEDTTTVRKLLFEDFGQERPILDDDEIDIEEGSTLLSRSPYEDEVFFFVTSDIMAFSKGSKRVDRNNIRNLRVSLDSEIVLTDGFYLLVINMSPVPI